MTLFVILKRTLAGDVMTIEAVSELNPSREDTAALMHRKRRAAIERGDEGKYAMTSLEVPSNDEFA
jgi:hypothetical protein